MGDGGCAVLLSSSSQHHHHHHHCHHHQHHRHHHSIAEFGNSDELVLDIVEEKIENAAIWPPSVGDMELEALDNSVDSNERRVIATTTTTYTVSTSATLRQGSRWDIRADDPSIVAEVKNARVKEEEEQKKDEEKEEEGKIVASNKATISPKAKKFEEASELVTGKPSVGLEGERRETGQMHSENLSKMAKDDDKLKQGRPKCPGNKPSIRDRHYRHNQGATREGTLDKVAELTRNETTSRSFNIGYDKVYEEEDNEFDREIMPQLEKGDKYKIFGISSGEHKRSVYRRRESTHRFREHGYDHRESKREASDRKRSADEHGIYYRRSYSRDQSTDHNHKRDVKGRSDRSDHYSSPKKSQRNKENADSSIDNVAMPDTRLISNHEELFKHVNDSDKCTVISSLSNKEQNTHILEFHDEGIGGTTDRKSSSDNLPNGVDHVQIDGEPQLSREIEAQSQNVHVEEQSATMQKEDSCPVDMDDVPMDLSPAPAEDIVANSLYSCVEHDDRGQIEHMVCASECFDIKDDGKEWVYLDSNGVMQGPSQLNTLKRLMAEGKLQSDHMVKVDGTDDWFTLEHAGLPHVEESLKRESVIEPCLQSHVIEKIFESSESLNPRHELEIDERVRYLMDGFELFPGKEKDVILEALMKAVKHQHTGDEHASDDEGGLSLGWSQNLLNSDDYCLKDPQTLKESLVESDADTDKGNSNNFQSSFQSSRKWTSRGGDWRLMCEIDSNGNQKLLGRPEKTVLNEGIPLCETKYHGIQDPRRQSSLYEAPMCRTLELPQWAYRYWEETKGECLNTFLENYNASKTTTSCTPRSQTLTGRDGIHSDSSEKIKDSNVTLLTEQKLDHADISAGVSLTSNNCAKNSFNESECRNLEPVDGLIMIGAKTENCLNSIQQVLTKKELNLEEGEWFYIDGKGQEIGPFTYTNLQLKAQDGLLYSGTSVYRKNDDTWVPLAVGNVHGTQQTPTISSIYTREDDAMASPPMSDVLSSFHELYPQFIGYMCGKLHEHVMKSYKNRDFSAMLHEGSRNCFVGKSSKKLSMNDLTTDSIHDDWKERRPSLYPDGATEPMDCDTPHSSYLNPDVSQVFRSGDNAKRLKTLSKFGKIGGDMVDSKEYGRDKEQYDNKHKQLYAFGSEDSFPALDRKLEKDMVFVLQNLKDVKVPDSKKVSSDGRRALAYLEIEDKLRSGLYPANMPGFRAFKHDLLAVARMLFRGKDKAAGSAVFGKTFRLIAQLEAEFRWRDISHSRPHKRKYHEYKSESSFAGRKRWIESTEEKPGFDNRRKSYDDSSEEDEHDLSFDYKTDVSGTDDEDDYSSQEDEDQDTEKSDSEVESESEAEEKAGQEKEPLSEDETDNLIWGARMTKAAMVPPVTRKYESIEEYAIVADEEEVKKRMIVSLPEDYDKIVRAQEDRGIEFSHLEMPELREYQPRKRVLAEVLEQEVYGIDPYTHNLLIDSMPTNRTDFSDDRKHQLIEEDLLKALNKEVRQFTGSVKAPTKYSLELVVNRAADECRDFAKRTFISALAKNMRGRRESHANDNYVAYRKGLGVVCNHPAGFEKDEFIVEFFGEVYPAWRWYEKQDAIRSFQKKDKDAAPEFYNIFLERPKGDALGYDLVVVDAMHKANYASRICHSCRPNCEARVTAVDGKYQIGVYTLRAVEYGEELTFDYNSITESKEEHEKSVCLCGSHVCRGSYLNFAGPDTFQEIMKADHGVLHRHDLLLQACTANLATKADWDVLRQAGLGSCLLDGLPEWTIKYAAGVMRFLNEERLSLPREILKTILSERRMEEAGESEALDAEIQADGVFNTRLQNLAITLDKVRYVFKNIYGDPKVAPPPLRMMDPTEVVGLMWKNENSVLAELLHGMAQHSSQEAFSEFKCKVQEHEPLESGDQLANLQKSLLWLRDELCKAPITCGSRHDAAADLIHLYAHTKLFFTSQDYSTFESPSLRISPLDLGPKHAHKLGTAPFKEWAKTYNKDFVLGQLIFWYKPNESDPGASLEKASKGCLILPDSTSCYANSPQRISYSSLDRLKMFRRMEYKPQRQWNWKGQNFWEFNNSRRLLGSPMMDAIHEGTTVNKEMMDWLKRRTRAFRVPWENQQ